MNKFDQHAVEQALAGNLVLSVAEAEALYSERGDAAAFEVLAAAVNAEEGEQRAVAEAVIA